MTSDLLAPLDLAFWNMESDRHPMHLGALGVFAAHSPTAGAHAADLLAARAAAVPGLRMRIRDLWQPFAFGGATREADPDFDPLDHVRLHAPTDDFQAVAGRLMERPMERGRPPWEAHVLPGADGMSFAVLFKFHHALADGLRALKLAAGVLDPVDVPERAPRAVEPPQGLLSDVRRLPERLPGLVRGRCPTWAGPWTSAPRSPCPPSGCAPAAALTCAPSGTRRTAGVVIDIDDVHRVRKSAGGTVNDVPIAVVAGALRRWLDERGDGSRDVAPRALIPVSRRRPRTAQPQGNRLSGYLIRLPVHDADPLRRLETVRTAMLRNKDAGPNRGPVRSRCSPITCRRSDTGSAGRWSARRPGCGSTSWSPACRCPASGCGSAGTSWPRCIRWPRSRPARRWRSRSPRTGGRVHYGLVADARAVPDLDRFAYAVSAEVETPDGLRPLRTGPGRTGVLTRAVRAARVARCGWAPGRGEAVWCPARRSVKCPVRKRARVGALRG